MRLAVGSVGGRAVVIGAVVVAAALSLVEAQTPAGQSLPAQPARPAPPGGADRPAVPADPVAGNWRGTVKSAAGFESPIVITIVRKGDGYTGTTSGMSPTESPMKRVTVTGTQISIEAADDSTLGAVTLTAELAADGNALKGAGTIAVGAQKFEVTLALQRRPRADAVQPHVEQRIDYFVGRWTFEYIGAEYPPLSSGGRSGTATFTRSGASNFVSGCVNGEVAGKAYQEQLSIGHDPETNALAFVEKRGDGVELVSVASWRSPIAISFLTSPIQANGRTYQLRRLLSVHSATSFGVTEELSIDGGPFKRLGTGHYTKQTP